VISVGSGEKGRCDVVIRARAAGGHASTPWGKRNPLLVLAEAVRRIDAWRPEPAPASPLFQAMAPWLGLDGITKENVEAAIEKLGQRVPALLASLRGQSRMTLTPTVLHCGDKANAIPTEATLTCDARLLPGQTLTDLEAVVRGILDGLEGVEFTASETSEPSLSPFDERLRGIFERSASPAVGEPVEVAPVWCVGATDAHFVRAAGTPVYGFQLVDPKADPTRLSIHCVNESIEVGMLLPCALALAHFAAEYLEQ
jgi:acetylornithine deacetylase/succinyl-diaminopimelate desuccinylase-like protein